MEAPASAPQVKCDFARLLDFSGKRLSLVALRMLSFMVALSADNCGAASNKPAVKTIALIAGKIWVLKEFIIFY